MMESNSIMNSADVEMQKVVVADLIHLSPDERDALNQFDLAACDERIQELVNFIKYPTIDALISDVLCQLTLYQQKSQLEAKRYFQLQTAHQMTLQRENAAKLELSKAKVSMEKAEAKLVDLKADELKKASAQRGEQTPTFRYLICIFTHSSCSTHSRGQTQTAVIQHLSQSLPFLNLVKVFNLLPQTLTEMLEVRWSPVVSCQIPLQ
ncbi:hypothetical protein AMECASPLE_038256 [Ameca splendens]|uniref:Uncharacterized protein n=1 Tax=Ameca splendens TaxID=208324 RepID=A0ABV1A552_9TELE